MLPSFESALKPRRPLAPRWQFDGNPSDHGVHMCGVECHLMPVLRRWDSNGSYATLFVMYLAFCRMSKEQPSRQI